MVSYFFSLNGFNVIHHSTVSNIHAKPPALVPLAPFPDAFAPNQCVQPPAHPPARVARGEDGTPLEKTALFLGQSDKLVACPPSPFGTRYAILVVDTTLELGYAGLNECGKRLSRKAA